MLLLKLLQSLIKTLNSNGTPGQVAMGMALGAALGLTPVASLHNAVVFALALILNVSLGGFFLGWSLAAPLGFALDPLFHLVGTKLLEATALVPLWTTLYNVPGVPLTRFNNSIVLGSLVVWLLSIPPVYLVLRYLVATYRESVYERLRKTRFFKVVAASKLANLWALFHPEIG